MKTDGERRTRQRIIEVAQTVFRERGYEAPLAAIQAGAGLSNGSLFHYFPKKPALAQAVRESVDTALRNAALSALQQPGLTPQQALAAALESYMADAVANASTELRVLLPRVGKTTAATKAVSIRIRREIEVIETWAKPLIQNKLIAELPAGVIHALIFGPADQLIEAHVLRVGSVDLVTRAPVLAEAVWQALRHDPMKASEVKKPTRRIEPIKNQATLGI